MNDRRQSNSYFEQEVLTQLGDIKALCATNKAENKAVSDRVTTVECKNTRDDWRHWITVVVLMPLMMVLHGFSRHMGCDV